MRLKDPLTPRVGPALVNFLNRFIIMTGGYDLRYVSEVNEV